MLLLHFYSRQAQALSSRKGLHRSGTAKAIAKNADGSRWNSSETKVKEEEWDTETSAICGNCGGC